MSSVALDDTIISSINIRVYEIVYAAQYKRAQHTTRRKQQQLRKIMFVNFLYMFHPLDRDKNRNEKCEKE